MGKTRRKKRLWRVWWRCSTIQAIPIATTTARAVLRRWGEREVLGQF